MSRLPRTGVLPLVCAALLATSCGAALRTLPTGPGMPASDARPAFDAAAAACRRVISFSAEMAVGGSAGGNRLRGRVLVGLAAPASALLDAAAPFGASLFIYAASETQVTLLLPRDQRVLRHGDPAAVLEAVTGVPLGPADLRRTLTGCAPEGEPGAGREFGSGWRMVTVGDADVYLRRRAEGAWRIVAVVHHQGRADGWRADYDDFLDDLPTAVRLVSADSGRRFDLRVRLSQLEVNPRLGPEVFDVAVPPTLVPMTLDELRASGPMAEVTR